MGGYRGEEEGGKSMGESDKVGGREVVGGESSFEMLFDVFRLSINCYPSLIMLRALRILYS